MADTDTLNSWRYIAQSVPKPLLVRGVSINGYSKTRPFSSDRIEPSANSVILIFGIGSEWDFYDHLNHATRRSAALCGYANKPQRVVNQDRGECLEVSLPVEYVVKALGSDLTSLTGTIAIADAFGHEGAELEERVTNASSFDAASSLVSRFLSDRMVNDLYKIPQQLVLAHRLVSAGAGRLAVSELAKKIGWSERYLSKKYRAVFGCSVKRAARLQRFHAAHRAIVDSSRPLIQVAAELGYYDQSHMIRDFHEFAGASPVQVCRQENSHSMDVTPSAQGRSLKS